MDLLSKPIRVMIVDDHDIVRRGIKTILSEIPDIVVSAEASTAAEAMKLVRSSDFDVILLDISLPGQSGLDIIPHLKTERPNLPILVLSMYPENQFSARVLKLGASGFLNKSSASDHLEKAIRIVHKGEFYVSQAIAQKLIALLRGTHKEIAHEELTEREFEVLLLIVSGKEVKEIAEDLSLSEKTVRAHRTNILNKLDLRNNVELTRYAIEQKLL